MPLRIEVELAHEAHAGGPWYRPIVRDTRSGLVLITSMRCIDTFEHAYAEGERLAETLRRRLVRMIPSRS